MTTPTPAAPAAQSESAGDVVAAVLVVDRLGRLLLQLRDGNTRIDPHRWCVPGGHVDPGEEPRAAAAREVWEETGLTVDGLELVWRGTGPSSRYPGAAIEYVIYAARTDATDDQVRCHEGAAMRFVPADEAAGLEYGPTYGVVVPMFLQSETYRRLHGLPQPFTSPVDVLLIYTEGKRVLLGLRANTGFADGQYNLPSGKLDPDETVTDGMIREAREEAGLHLTEDDLRFSGVMHWRNHLGQSRIGFFFHVPADPARHGEPVNTEPHKCAGLSWHPIDDLPGNLYPYSRHGIHMWADGQPFAVHGWATARSGSPTQDLGGDLEPAARKMRGRSDHRP